jgi:hypothetical protein
LIADRRSSSEDVTDRVVRGSPVPAPGTVMLGALAFDLCALAVMLDLVTLTGGIVLLIPVVGAAFVCGCRTFAGALGTLICRDRTVARGGLAIPHRGHSIDRGGPPIVPVRARFVWPGGTIANTRAEIATSGGTVSSRGIHVTLLGAPVLRVALFTILHGHHANPPIAHAAPGRRSTSPAPVDRRGDR